MSDWTVVMTVTLFQFLSFVMDNHFLTLQDSVLRVSNGQTINISRNWLCNVYKTLFGVWPSRTILSEKESANFAAAVAAEVEDILTACLPCNQPLTWYNPFAAIFGGKELYSQSTRLTWELMPITYGHGFTSKCEFVWKNYRRIAVQRVTKKEKIRAAQPTAEFMSHLAKPQFYCELPEAWDKINPNTGEWETTILPVLGKIDLGKIPRD